jgi:hypothetical protein
MIRSCTCGEGLGGRFGDFWVYNDAPAAWRHRLCAACQTYKDATLEGAAPIYGSQVWKRVVLWFLYWLEVLYLRTSGWYRLPSDADHWQSPRDYPFTRKDPYTHGHAVNAQKQVDGNPRYRRLADAARKLREKADA